MSELIQKEDNWANFRWRLLTGVSALALTAYIAATPAAKADDTDRPTVWIELGGQLNRLSDQQESYTPPFLALEPSQFDSPLKSMKPPSHSFDWTGNISIQPRDSDFVFTASVRYGRAQTKNHFHQQTYPNHYTKYFYNTYSGKQYQTIQPFAAQFIDAKASNIENHVILDFQVGKDFGIGLLGARSTSSLNVGVRYAQFTSKSNISLNENPDWAFHVHTYNFYSGLYIIQALNQQYHSYAGSFRADRGFHGIGPAISWKSSEPFAGSEQDGLLAFDWGLNASLLFGRQKAQTEHHETARYHPPVPGPLGDKNTPGRHITLYHHPATAPAYYSTRERNVTVPNVGGFAGVSFRYSNAKISMGYRADFFFGAMDGGIDVRKTYDRNFYGPFAAISIGLGR